MLKGLTVAAAVLALATGAVVAFASSDDSGGDNQPRTAAQEGSPTPAPEAEAEAWLGVSVHPSDEGGVVIKRAFEDGPAARAGLGSGDRITSFEGTQVDTPRALREAIEAKSPGDQVTLTVVKAGGDAAASEDVTVTLGERPSRGDIRGRIDEKIGEYFDRFLGGSFRYSDDEGKTVEIEVVPGTVSAISDTEVTIDVNGDEGERSFDIPEAANVSDGLESGDRVLVILENGEVKAIKSGHFPMLPFGPGGFDGPLGPGGWAPFRHDRAPGIYCEGGPGPLGEFFDCDKEEPEAEATPEA
jgi:membrane-associated protease RseP (regulator of RpoE activity)